MQTHLEAVDQSRVWVACGASVKCNSFAGEHERSTYKMAMQKEELKDWIDSVPDGTLIAVDDGGLSLVVVDNQEIYCEVGGIPEDG